MSLWSNPLKQKEKKDNFFLYKLSRQSLIKFSAKAASASPTKTKNQLAGWLIVEETEEESLFVSIT